MTSLPWLNCKAQNQNSLKNVNRRTLDITPKYFESIMTNSATGADRFIINDAPFPCRTWKRDRKCNKLFINKVNTMIALLAKL